MRSPGLALAVLLLGAVARAGDAVPDPTRPEGAGAAAPAETTGRLELRAVLIGSLRRVAVINGRAVGVGDRVDGAEVLAIEPGQVRIRAADGERELSLAGAVRLAPAEEWSR